MELSAAIMKRTMGAGTALEAARAAQTRKQQNRMQYPSVRCAEVDTGSMELQAAIMKRVVGAASALQAAGDAPTTWHRLQPLTKWHRLQQWQKWQQWLQWQEWRLCAPRLFSKVYHAYLAVAHENIQRRGSAR